MDGHCGSRFFFLARDLFDRPCLGQPFEPTILHNPQIACLLRRNSAQLAAKDAAYASELAEEKITGEQFPFSWRQLMKDALRGALIAARNGFLELACSIVIWLLTLFVPFISPISFVLLFLVSAYFYGFSMFDYVFERRRMRIGETARAVNSQLGAVMANGMCFSLLMKIPLIGLMLAPVMASVGAVITMTRKEGTQVVKA